MRLSQCPLVHVRLLVKRSQRSLPAWRGQPARCSEHAPSRVKRENDWEVAVQGHSYQGPPELRSDVVTTPTRLREPTASPRALRPARSGPCTTLPCCAGRL